MASTQPQNTNPTVVTRPVNGTTGQIDPSVPTGQTVNPSCQSVGSGEATPPFPPKEPQEPVTQPSSDQRGALNQDVSRPSTKNDSVPIKSRPDSPQVPPKHPDGKRDGHLARIGAWPGPKAYPGLIPGNHAPQQQLNAPNPYPQYLTPYQQQQQQQQQLQFVHQEAWKQATDHFGNQINTLSSANDDLKRRQRELQDDVVRLTKELREAQAGYANLRKHLQVGDDTEARDIVTEFRDVNRAIEDAARFIADASLKHFENRDDLTTGNAQNFDALKESFLRGMPPLEEMLDYGFRSILCQVLFDEIFKPFHPAFGRGNRTDKTERLDRHLRDIYKQIRIQEPQVVAGRWRANTYKALDAQVNSHDALLSNIVQFVVNDNLISLLTAIFPQPLQPGSEIYNHIQTDVLLFDFVPFHHTVISVGTLGLKSILAVEGKRDPEMRIQEKVKILTTQFFGD
ncbi:uncharacterized protein EI90DRAFT_3043436 [Cantharellus anzutake]|uniref:uncharacterized protein n=1 Tax=Cantharellus anzutake TaxID=1750568 RepID=UPI001908C772|nr:uncharacterized protein EI90DRAFT_3043436 [Cantharellus anzutake]KAF8337584.1 hypothetical protein EI90DRAFT_3043436 [Cantharellus anzutake]